MIDKAMRLWIHT